MTRRDGKSIKRLDGGWSDVVLVCRKCSKKLGGGFGRDGQQRLAKVLRHELGAERKPRLKKGRTPRPAVLEIGCLGLCPRDAVVAVRPGERGGILIVPARSSPCDILAGLGMPPV